jgi:hypothetical protein
MAEEDLRKIASLLRERNVIDEKIAVVIHRPMTVGHAVFGPMPLWISFFD